MPTAICSAQNRRISSIKRVFLIAIVMFAPGVLPTAAADAQETQKTQQILNTSNNYLELVREYWPRISLGNVQAMTVTYDALNNCWHFRDSISKAESIDDLDTLLADSHVSQLEFACEPVLTKRLRRRSAKPKTFTAKYSNNDTKS
jgi:hypothetical protein